MKYRYLHVGLHRSKTTAMFCGGGVHKAQLKIENQHFITQQARDVY